MSIVLLPHGETSSPTNPLTTSSCLNVIKITVIIPSCLSVKTGHRPSIACAPDNASERTAALVACMFHTDKITCAALNEDINENGLRELAFRLLGSSKDFIGVTHATTIETLAAIISEISGQTYRDRRTKPLNALQFVVINTESREIYTVTAPAKILA